MAFVAGNRVAIASRNLERAPMAQPASGLSPDDHLRTRLHEDGSRTLWIRTADQKRISQYQFSADGALLWKSVYRINPSGQPLSARIFDPHNTDTFRVSFGYRKEDGMLVEERIFDSQILRQDGRGIEMPVGRVLHEGNAGNSINQSVLVESTMLDLPPQLVVGFANPFEGR